MGAFGERLHGRDRFCLGWPVWAGDDDGIDVATGYVSCEGFDGDSRGAVEFVMANFNGGAKLWGQFCCGADFIGSFAQ